MTDLLLQPTGNPSQYEVIADEQIVGRIALFSALRDRSKPWIWTIDLPLRMVASRRTASRHRARPPWRRSPVLVPGKQNVKARSPTEAATRQFPV